MRLLSLDWNFNFNWLDSKDFDLKCLVHVLLRDVNLACYYSVFIKCDPVNNHLDTRSKEIVNFLTHQYSYLSYNTQNVLLKLSMTKNSLL